MAEKIEISQGIKTRYSGKRTLPYWGSAPNDYGWLYGEVADLIASEALAFREQCVGSAENMTLGLSVIQGAVSSIRRQRRRRLYRDSDSE